MWKGGTLETEMSLLASELQKSFLHFLLASGWLIGPVGMLPPTRVGHPTSIGNCYHGLLAKHLHVSPDSFLHTARTSAPQARQFTLGPYQGCLTSNPGSSLSWPLRDTTLLSAQAGNKQKAKDPLFSIQCFDSTICVKETFYVKECLYKIVLWNDTMKLHSPTDSFKGYPQLIIDLPPYLHPPEAIE